MKLAILTIGLAFGASVVATWLARYDFDQRIDRCDTEVLTLQAELSEARESFWRDIASCKEQGCTP